MKNKKHLHIHYRLFPILLTLLISLSSGIIPPLSAAIVAEKTPDDVFAQVQLLAESVQILKDKNNFDSPWPHVAVKEGYEPRHVLQKALEILGKINRFRVNIQKTSEISVPRFPGRDITPNEVYSAVVRLRREMALLIVDASPDVEADAGAKTAVGLTTSGDVYAALSEISLALDETLGLCGFTPSDVYVQSLRILNLVKFLRKSQNLSQDAAKPARTSGKLPNHTLQASYRLFEKIRVAEKNLWMKPLTVPEVPRRVITPVEVFDTTSVTLAELQRITYRLGLERDFKDPLPESGKSPDDVIQNLEWAILLLPDFSMNQPLRQFDRKALKKTSNHVYSVTEHILLRLREFRRLSGIRSIPRKVRIIHGLQPPHVYEKALEILEKIDTIRNSSHLGAIAVQRYPLRIITPSEVFDLALRLDEELDILFRQQGMKSNLWLTASRVIENDDKTPSDVFLNMRRISMLLDTILGSEGFTPSHVFREAVSVENNIKIITRSLGISTGLEHNAALSTGIEPRDVYLQARALMKLVLDAKRRAGIFGVRDISIPPSEPVPPNDVFNQVRIIDAELTEIKVFLGISGISDRQPFQVDKTPAHAFQVLKRAECELLTILHGETTAQSPESQP